VKVVENTQENNSFHSWGSQNILEPVVKVLEKNPGKQVYSWGFQNILEIQVGQKLEPR
jgi:hypothetical protein